MTYNPIARGTENWDSPLNTALAQLDANITTVAGSVANTMDTTSNQTVTGIKTFTAQTNFVGNTGASVNINSNQNGDTNPRFDVLANGTVNWGPGNAATDVSLSRSGASSLTLTGSLATTGTLSTSAGGRYVAFSSAGGTLIYSSFVTGDSQDRFEIDSNGRLLWSAGSGSMDTNLYRNAAGVLKTDQSLSVAANLTVGGIGAVASAYKTSDESRASTTTVTQDGALNVTIPSTGTYIFQAFIVYQTLQAAGFQAGFTFSGTTTASLYSINALSGGGTTDTGSARYVANAFGSPTNFTSGAGAGVSIVAFGEGSFVATTTGTLRFNWAQQTSNATATVVKAGSYLILTRIA